jgi:hypothetical protein
LLYQIAHRIESGVSVAGKGHIAGYRSGSCGRSRSIGTAQAIKSSRVPQATHPHPVSSERLGIEDAPQWRIRNCIQKGEFKMPLVTVVITLLVVGVLMWLVNSYIPMQGTIKGLLNAVVVIALVIWLVNTFGLMHYVTQFRVGPNP